MAHALSSSSSRRGLVAALLSLAALATAPLPGRADEPIAGAQAAADDSAFAMLDWEWHDAARDRAVPVRLYLPQGASAAQPVPLVVFSHGIGGSRAGYSYLGRYWASHGYASLHLQHVGSDRRIWLGSPFALVARLRDAASEAEAIARARDLHFALDQLLASETAPRIDAERIVAAGHSYGANTTLLAAGAQVERDGRRLDFRDPRIKAAILISAPPFYGESDPARILANVTVPTLHVTCTDDVIRIPGYYSTAADRLAVFDAIGGPRKTLAVFAGGSHSVFTDRAGTGGATLNPQVKEATRKLSLAFLQDVLDGQDGALRQWPAQFAGIVARYTRVGMSAAN
jgi:predicted dienelactone hydrolase